jgi:hypothetical protein
MSQQPITIDDIYALFRTSAQEFDRRIAEQERLAAESKSVFEKFLVITKGQKSPQGYSLSIYKKTKTAPWKQQRNHTPQT